MTNNAPVPFNPTTLADKLRERIRASLADLIPEEQWDAMMKAEVDRFLKPRVSGDGYYRTTTPSDFEAIAAQVIGDEVRSRLKKYFEESPEWSSRWASTGGMGCVPKRLEEMVERNLPVLMRECVASMFTGISTMSMRATIDALEERMRHT